MLILHVIGITSFNTSSIIDIFFFQKETKLFFYYIMLIQLQQVYRKIRHIYIGSKNNLSLINAI